MFASLLIPLAAQALAAPPAPPQTPVPPPAAAPATQHGGRLQIFIAPSGEVFRVSSDAPYPVAEWFARADANHDGKLSEREFDADFLRFFATLDLNHDGVIDGPELERYEANTPELHTGIFTGSYTDSEGEGEDGDSKPARQVGSFLGADDASGAGRFDLLRIPEPVASMDTRLTGRIDRQQAQDAADYRFSLLDGQHRGYLLLAELPQTFAQEHRSAGHRHGHGGGHGHEHGGRHRSGMGGAGMGGGMGAEGD